MYLSSFFSNISYLPQKLQRLKWLHEDCLLAQMQPVLMISSTAPYILLGSDTLMFTVPMLHEGLNLT